LFSGEKWPSDGKLRGRREIARENTEKKCEKGM
jgi:hypothetical protein